MPVLSITSLRGGMNNTDPAIALPDDQCVEATNVEFVESMLGERRTGTSAITLPAFLSARDRVTFLHRHLPTADETAAELWALGVTGTSAAHLGHKDTAWSEVTISDTPELSGMAPYRWKAVTLHGKLHFMYDSDQDRAHVWDGTTMRRSGFPDTETMTAPTAADAGGGGSLSGTRYGRVRVVEVSGSEVLRRSEPSAVQTFDPDGSHASITWTRPTLVGEGETHWEIELSVDNATFYMMSRIVIGTTTYTDSELYTDGYVSGTLSETVGNYSPLWSARYATADEDRLIIAGSYENDALASRVGWTPVFNADGVGNDERLEFDTDPTVDLDTYKNGPITNLSAPALGAIWVTKQRAIYKMTRSGKRSAAYDFDLFSDVFGAVHDSLVEGVDDVGNPCLYAIDVEHGPYRIGLGGIRRCGEDLRATWKTINIDATAVVCSAEYYPKKKQVIWNLATTGNDRPDTAIVLHVDKSRTAADGIRKGWAIWNGTRAQALTMCLYASNIEDNTARNLSLVPFIALEGDGLIHQCDLNDDDDGTAYTSTVTTKPYGMGTLLNQFQVRATALLAKAVTGTAVNVSCVRDFGLDTSITVEDVGFTPVGNETAVCVQMDQFSTSEMHVSQMVFTDAPSNAGQWQLHRFEMVGNAGQSA